MEKKRVETLTGFLKDLKAVTPDIEASPVISGDELMICPLQPHTGGGDRGAAMSAAMLSRGERKVNELARGQLSDVCVEGEHGYIRLIASGNAFFIALARKDANLGLVFLDLKRISEEFADTAS